MNSSENAGDHLSSSFTDLMSSLMVIFVLLLLAFISHTSHHEARVVEDVRDQLRLNLKSKGFAADNVLRDPRDSNAILVVISGRLMNFENQQASLKPSGRHWLNANIPRLAAVICDPRYMGAIDSIVVEGHTDSFGWAGRSAVESENANLELSQKRSLTVVQEALHSLDQTPSSRTCFLDRLSASGRGQRDLQSTPENSRRVVLRVRVRANAAQALEKELSSPHEAD